VKANLRSLLDAFRFSYPGNFAMIQITKNPCRSWFFHLEYLVTFPVVLSKKDKKHSFAQHPAASKAEKLGFLILFEK